MKKLFILSFLSVAWLAFAETDSLLVVQIPPINVGDSGENCVWDYSMVKDSLLHDVYVLRDSANPTEWDVCKMNNKYLYQEKNDTLYKTGFENATTLIQYHQPIACFKTPITFRDSVIGDFAGRGEYGHLLPVTTHGSYNSKVDGHGTLILPNQEFADVYRVVTLSEITKHIYDTTHFQMREYRWYKRNKMYPLLEVIEVRTELQEDTICSRFAFYTDMEEEDSVEQQDSVTVELEPEDEDLPTFTDGKFLPNPVVNDLTVSYHLTRTATIWFSLHSSQGIVMFRSSPAVQEEGDWQLTIPMSGYPTDDYVLYIHVDDIVLAETIIKM